MFIHWLGGEPRSGMYITGVSLHIPQSLIYSYMMMYIQHLGQACIHNYNSQSYFAVKCICTYNFINTLPNPPYITDTCIYAFIHYYIHYL